MEIDTINPEKLNNDEILSIEKIRNYSQKFEFNKQVPKMNLHLVLQLIRENSKFDDSLIKNNGITLN